MKSKEVILEKIIGYFSELGLSIKCSTHTRRKDKDPKLSSVYWSISSVKKSSTHTDREDLIQQEPLVFLTEPLFINRSRWTET